jgi:hypothetical protein
MFLIHKSDINIFYKLLNKKQKMSKKRIIDGSKPLENIDTSSKPKRIIDVNNTPLDQLVTTDRTSLFDSKLGEYNLDSQYDEGIVSGLDQNDYRARNQSALDKAGNAIPKFLGTVTTSAIEPVINITYGIPQAISTGKFDAIYDNDLSRSLDSLNKYIAEEFPHYYSQSEQSKGLLSAVPFTEGSANFWFDKVGNGAGFLLGSYLSARATAGLGLGSSAAKFYKWAFDLNKTVNNATKGTSVLNAISQGANATNLAKHINQYTSAAIGAMGEAGMEARAIKDETFNMLKKLHPDWSDEKIESVASSAGNTGFALNMAIVGASNLYQFGRSLTGGYNVERKTLSNIIKGSSSYEIQKLSNTGKIINSLATSLEEFGQETLQFATEKGSSNYYTKKYDPEGINTVNDIILSTLHGLSEAYGTEEGLEAGLIGAIIGSPSGVSTFKQQLNDDSSANAIVELLNNYKLSESFKPLFESAVKHISYEKDKENSLKRGDIFSYKNAEFDQFKSYVKSRIDSGRFDILLNELNEVRNYSEEEFKQAFGFPENEPLPKGVHEYTGSLIDKAKELHKINNDININYSNESPLIKELMFDAASTLSNIDEREKSLSKEINEITSKYINQTILTKYPTIFSTLNPFIDSVATDEITKDGIDIEKIRKKNKFNYRDKIKKEFNNLNKDINPLDVQKLKVLIDDYNNLTDRREDFINKYNDLLDSDNKEKIESSIIEKEQKEKIQQINTQKQFENEQKVNEAEQKLIQKKEVESKIKDLKKEIKTQKKDSNLSNVEVPSSITEEDPSFNQPSLEDMAAALQMEAESISSEKEESIVKEQEIKQTKSEQDGFVKDIVDISKVNSELEENTLERGDKLIDSNFKFIKEGNKSYRANKVAYLSLEYIKVNTESGFKLEDKYVEGLLQRNTNVNSLIESPEIKVGDQISFVIDLTNDLYPGNKDNYLEVPIAIIHETTQETLGYLHTDSWINEDNIVEDVEGEKEKVRRIRQQIFNNPTTKFITKIDSKSFGHLNKNKVHRKLFEGLGNGTKIADNIKLFIGKYPQKGSGFYINPQEEADYTNIINVDPVIEGSIGAILPTAVEGHSMAVYLKNNKIGDQDVDTIINAITKHLSGENTIIGDFDLASSEGLKNFLNQITYTRFVSDLKNDSNPTESFYLAFDKESGKLTSIFFSKSKKFKVSEINSSEFKTILKNKYKSVSLANLNNPNEYYYPSVIEGELTVKPYKDYQTYLNDTETLTTDIQGFKVGETDNYTFFSQPSVEFDPKITSEQETYIEETPIIDESGNEQTLEQLITEKLPEDLDFEGLDDIEIEKSESIESGLAELFVLDDNGNPLYSANQQKQITDSIRREVQLSQQEGLRPKQAFDKAKAVFINGAKRASELSKINTAARYNQILQPEIWNQFEKFVIQQLNALGTNIQFTEDSEFEDSNAVEQKLNYDDSSSFSVNTKDTASAEIKKWLSTITKPERNFLGLPLFYDLDFLWDNLSRDLSDLSAEEMIIKLQELGKTAKPEYLVIAEQLSKVPQYVQNEFFVTFNKQTNRHTTLGWTVDGKGNYEFKNFFSNRNQAELIVAEKWQENLKLSQLVTVDKEGNLFINTELGKKVLESFEAWLNTNPEQNLEQGSELFNFIGIEIGEQELKEIFNNPKNAIKKKNYKNGKTLLTAEALPIFKTLAGLEKSEKETEDRFELNNPFSLNSPKIRALASLSLDFKPSLFSNSYRDSEGKSRYSFSNNTFLSKEFQKINNQNKEQREAFLKAKQKTSYASTSYWIDQMLTNPKFQEVFNLEYMDGFVLEDSGKDAVLLKNTSDREHELIKIGLFQNQGNKDSNGQRTIKTVYLTPSDKTTMPIITSIGVNITLNGELGSYKSFGSKTDKVLKDMVIAEITRIQETYKQINSLSEDNKIKDYHTGSKMGTKFLIFPELNDIIKAEDLANPNLNIFAEYNDVIVNTINTKINKLISDKKADWENLGIIENNKIKYSDKTYLKNLGFTGPKQLEYSIADYVINNFVSNVNVSQLISGDPAQHGKKDLTNTFINYGKRLAKDIAPGLEGNWKKGEKFKTVYLEDSEIDSQHYEVYKKAVGNIAEFYGNKKKLNQADAQEYTTLSEHRRVMEAFGRLTPEMDSAIQRLMEGGNNLEDISKVLQPMKPVYVQKVINEDLKLEELYYIKTSSFPLIPALTQGLEIDKLRVAMETGNIQRAVFESGVKLGLKKRYSLYKDKNKQELNSFDFSKFSIELPREGFRIQLELPFDETKAKILEGSQGRKLISANEATSPETAELFKNLHDELTKREFDKLLDRLNIKKDDNFYYFEDLKSLQKVITEEGQGRNWSINEIQSLGFNEKGVFKIPLAFNNASSKIESLLLSLVNNAIVKQKLPGRSYVQGSNFGFHQLSKEAQSQILWAGKDRSPLKYIRPIFDDKGNVTRVAEAEILLPFYFKDNEGNTLNVKDFVDSEGNIDTERIPKELLKVYGYRIPTQGLNSMMVFKVKGFIPKELGELAIVPAEVTAQMGSDFDVDKLFTNRFNYEFDGEKFTKVKFDENIPLEEQSKEAIQNRIVEIYMETVLNPKNLDKVLSPITFDPLGEVANEINNTLNAGKEDLGFFYDKSQREIFKSNSGGKAGCLGYGTKVLMFDGTFKEVQDIKVGDQLMGVDSTPRTVLELCRGEEQMYWVRQTRGIDYRINESHILSLIHKPRWEREEIVNIKLTDFLEKNKTFRLYETFGYKSAGIEFSKKETPIDPYYLGLWLGDGSTRSISIIHNIDNEIRNYLHDEYGIEHIEGVNNLTMRVNSSKLIKPFRKIYNSTKSGLYKEIKKYIPDNYLYSTKEDRLKLLAGLIDSDGSYCKLNKQYRITSNIPKLVEQIQFLTRSLGFYTSVKLIKGITKPYPNGKIYTCKDFWYINFIPECNIPVKIERKKQVEKSKFKNRLHTAIRIEKDIIDNYYGFVLDGDHLFMLEDFTVTHNTGISSLSSVHHAISQKAGLYLKEGKILFDNNIADRLDRVETLDESKLISDVISYVQSAAVDNAKEQVLGKTNINNTTFGVAMLLARAGYNEQTIAYFLSQESIKDYVNTMGNIMDSTNLEYDPQKVEKAITTLGEKYAKLAGRQDIISYSEYLNSSAPNINTSNLKEAFTSTKEASYYNLQLDVLNAFVHYNQIAKELSNIQSATTADTNGAGKKLSETQQKVNMIEALSTTNFIGNAENLLDETIVGKFAEYGQIETVKLFEQLLPFNSNAYKTAKQSIFENMGKINPKPEDIDFVHNEIKSYVYAMSDVLGDIDVDYTRFKLFFDTSTNKSLSTRIREYKTTPEGQNNWLLKRLITKTKIKEGDISKVEYQNSIAEGVNDSSEGIRAFIELEKSNPELAKDLILYHYLNGGLVTSKSFGKFIPVSSLEKLGIAKNLNNVNLESERTLENLSEQFFQHYPSKAIKIQDINTVFPSGKIQQVFTLNDIVPGEGNSHSQFYVEKINEFGKKVQTYPDYLSYRDGKKWYLFKAEGNTYKQIDTLGKQGFKEYTPSNSLQESLLQDNTVENIVVQSRIPSLTKNLIQDKSETLKVAPVQLSVDDIETTYALNENNLKKTVDIILDNRKGQENHISILLNTFKEKGYLNNLATTVKINNEANFAGNYNSSTDTITLNSKVLRNNSVSNDEMFDKLEHKFTHELVHTLTVKKLKTDSENKKAIQGLLGKSFNELIINKNEYRNFVLFNQARFKYKKGQELTSEESVVFNSENKNKYYGFSILEEHLDKFQLNKVPNNAYIYLDIREFVAEGLVNQSFAKGLGSVEFNSKRTLFGRLLDLVTKVLGIEKQGTVLENLITETLNLIEGTTSVEQTDESDDIEAPIKSKKKDKRKKLEFTQIDSIDTYIKRWNTQIVNLKKQIKEGSDAKNLIIENRIDALQSKIDNAVEAKNEYVILNTANEQLNWIEEQLSKEGLQLSELKQFEDYLSIYADLNRIIKFEDEFKEDQDIANRLTGKAQYLLNKLSNVSIDHITEYLNNYTKRENLYTKEELFGSQKETGAFTGNYMDAGTSRVPLVQLVNEVIQKMVVDINEDYTTFEDKFVEIDKEFKEYQKSKGISDSKMFDSLLQKNIKNELTGNLVGPYKQEFYNQLKEKSQEARKTGNWKGYWNWYNQNSSLELTSEMEEEYKKDLELAKDMFSDFTGNIVDKAGLMNWIEENSPKKYLELVSQRKSTEGYKGSKYLEHKPIKKWEDPQYNQIMSLPDNNPVKKYYLHWRHEMSKIRKRLPKTNTQKNYIPELKKDLFKDIRDNGLKEGFRGIKEAFWSNFTSNLEEIKSYQSVDPNTGKSLPIIPVYMFANKLGVKDKDLDLSRVLLATKSQQIGFTHKNKIEDLVLLAKRRFSESSELETTYDEKGNVVVKIDRYSDKKTLSKGNHKTIEQLDHLINSLLYDNRKNTEGVTSKKVKVGEDKDGDIYENISMTGITDSLIGYTQLKAMAFNVFNAVTNFSFGITGNMIEGAGGNNFTLKNAIKSFGNMVAATVPGTESNKKVTFLMKYFDVLVESNEIKYGRIKSVQDKYSQGLTSDKLFIMQKAGEFLAQGQTMGATLRSTEIKDLKGNKKSVWDAFIVDDKGNTKWDTVNFGPNPYESITDEQGNVIASDDKFKLQSKLRDVIMDVHGNYDPNSPQLFKRTWYGRLLGQFRLNWMAQGIHIRFSDKYFHERSGKFKRGRYNTIWGKDGFMYNEDGVLDLQRLKTNLKWLVGINPAEMSDLDKANIRKVFAELAMISSMFILGLTLKSLTLEEDDEEKQVITFFINQSYRLNRDLTFYLNPNSFKEVTKEVVPAIRTATDFIDLLPATYYLIMGKDEVKSGVFKGQSKLFYKTKKAFPVIKQYDNFRLFTEQVFDK